MIIRNLRRLGPDAGLILVVNPCGCVYPEDLPARAGDRYRKLHTLTRTGSSLMRIPLTSRLDLWLPWQAPHKPVPFPQNCRATGLATRFGHRRHLAGVAVVCGNDRDLPAPLAPAQAAAVVRMLKGGHPHAH